MLLLQLLSLLAPPYPHCYMPCLHCRGRADGVEFENTKKRGKPIVFLYDGRPFTGGMCEGEHK